MEQYVQIKQCDIDKKRQLLDLEIAGKLPYPIHGERFRISAVFSDGQIDRYFPMIAHGTVCEGDSTLFHAAVKIQLDTVFFEYHPGNPDDIILLQFSTCTPDHTWITLETDVTLQAFLFQSHTSQQAAGEMACPLSSDTRGSLRMQELKNTQKRGVCSYVYSVYRVIKYLVCTLLLPIWLLSGYLAYKGHGTLHPAAKGRQGKGAVFYHAHGIVMDMTGYGYSIREFKTNYYRRCYKKYGRRYPQTDGILFLSERQVEKGGNLDLVRSALADSVSVGELREFLVDRPVQKLSWKELRHLADLTAASRVIILEDFYPQLHALSIRPDTRILQLWHACGAFKLFGLSDLGISQHLKQDTRNHRSYHAALVSGEGIVPFYSEAFGIPSSHIYPVGVPRTDCFFQEETVNQKRQALYQRYPVLQGKRVVLFAPTFRGSGNQTAYYPFDRFPIPDIMETLPEDVVLIVKHHPFVHRKMEAAEKVQQRVLDLTGTENINDLLLLTDVLITDYSSVIFEAAILQIPMLFYVFDLEEYIQSRDLYFDFASFAPGQIVRELPDLVQAVQESLGTPEHPDLEKFRTFFLGAIDGHSTERVVQLVQQLYKEDDCR